MIHAHKHAHQNSAAQDHVQDHVQNHVQLLAHHSAAHSHVNQDAATKIVVATLTGALPLSNYPVPSGLR